MSVITKVRTDEGVVGIGEGGTFPPFYGESVEGIKICIDRYLAAAIKGQDPLNIERILERMDASIYGNPGAKAAIEIAVWDIAGRSLGVPVYKLLGGLYREEIPLYGFVWGGIGTAEEMGKVARELVEKGYKLLKMKVGIDSKQDMKNYEAVKDAIGEKAEIRVDANGGYTSDIAIKTFKKMEDYGGLAIVEQPVSRWNLDGMAIVSRSLNTPVMADESVFTPEDAVRIVKKEAAGIMLIKLEKHGGIYNAKKIANIAGAAGIPLGLTSMMSSAGAAAAMHFAAATRNVVHLSLIHI